MIIKKKDSSIKKKVREKLVKKEKKEVKNTNQKNVKRKDIEDQLKKGEIEISTSNLDDIGKILGFNEQNKSDELKFLKDTIPTFFKLKDIDGLSKTDIERHMVFPLSLLLDYSNDTLPIYNKFLKENYPDLYEERKVDIPNISNFIKSIYIQTSVSKDRKGRGEGTEISKGLMDMLRQPNINSGGINKVINDLKK